MWLLSTMLACVGLAFVSLSRLTHSRLDAVISFCLFSLPSLFCSFVGLSFFQLSLLPAVFFAPDMAHKHSRIGFVFVWSVAQPA